MKIGQCGRIGDTSAQGSCLTMRIIVFLCGIILIINNNAKSF